MIVEGFHIPVLLKESVGGLAISPSGYYADLTFGGGGHSREILRNLGEKGRLLAFDQDSDTFANIPDDDRLIFAHSNFRYLANFVRYHELGKLDGILADLGVSSHHFDAEQRGFSFRFDGPLDMRMNQRAKLSAADIVNSYDEEHLANVLYLYGELQQSRRIASTIAKRRVSKRIDTIFELVDIVKPHCGKDMKQDMARIFQALRIEVNDEMGALKAMLESSVKVLKPGGRISIITYHSLEDRLVKYFFKCGNFDGKVEKDFYGNVQSPLRQIGKVIAPNNDEIEQNPRSRSAKLRVAEKI